MTTPSTYKLGYPPLKNSVVPFAGSFQRDPTSSDIMDPTVGGVWPASTVWVNAATTGIWMFANVTAGAAVWKAINNAASGDIVGPASSTDNALVRFDGTTGKLVQNSVGIVSDLGIMTGIRPTLPAGTTVAGTAPIKFTSGVNLTAPEAGAMEYDGTNLYYTDGTSARRGIVTGPASVTDNMITRYDGTTGKLVQSSLGIISDAGVLTGLTSIGIGIAPTAYLGLAAGTATAGTSPLKFASGTNLSVAEAGSVEYNGTNLFYTDSVPTRNTIAVGPGTSTSNGLVSWSSTTGYKLLSNTPTISSAVITFPSGGGNVLTAGAGAAERKGSFTFNGSGTHTKILTTSAITGCVIVYSIVTLGTVTAAQAILTTIDTGVGFTPVSAANNDSSVVNWSIAA